MEIIHEACRTVLESIRDTVVNGIKISYNLKNILKSSKTHFRIIESKYNVQIDPVIKELVLKYGSIFTINDKYEILNFNTESPNSITKQNISGTIDGYLPFMNDGFGNYYCSNSAGEVVFLRHDSSKIEKVANGFFEFCNTLK